MIALTKKNYTQATSMSKQPRVCNHSDRKKVNSPEKH